MEFKDFNILRVRPSNMDAARREPGTRAPVLETADGPRCTTPIHAADCC